MKVYIKTLGCRTNQADSLELVREIGKGFTLVDSIAEAEAVIVNTCAVTSRAERDARLILGQVARKAPGAAIAVTGCMTEVRPAGEWKRFGAVTLFPNHRKMEIPCWLRSIKTATTCNESSGDSSGRLQGVREPVRYPIKIQEGCSRGCSFCIVPRSRGVERSLRREKVFEKIEMAAARGAGEVVLTGVQLGAWGRDLDPPSDIGRLLAYLLERGLPVRVRLSSIEPWGVTDELIGLFASRPPKLCPHLHLPLQSGSDEILARMRRPYSAQKFADLVSRLTLADPDICIGTDVIAGFPGEGDREFAETVALLRDLNLAYLHPFSFSPREGTEAAQMNGRVPTREIRKRMALLREIGVAKRRAYMARFVGRSVELVVETAGPNGEIVGTTDHFVKIEVRSATGMRKLTAGSLATVVPTFVEEDRLVAEYACKT